VRRLLSLSLSLTFGEKVLRFYWLMVVRLCLVRIEVPLPLSVEGFFVKTFSWLRGDDRFSLLTVVENIAV